MRLTTAIALSSAVLSAACAEYDVTARAPSVEDANVASCSVVKDHSRPLVVEWPASARGDLEVRMRSGLVAVKYVGCAMEVLDRCAVRGSYRYVAFTPKEDRLVIRDRKELFANLPMGAAGLSGKLDKHGEIDLAMTLVGKYETDATAQPELSGDCAEATHLVTAMTVGAFALSAGHSTEAGVGASVAGIGAKASTRDERETLTRDGDPSMCQRASLEDVAPPRWCGAVVRVEVVPTLQSAPVPAPRLDPRPVVDASPIEASPEPLRRAPPVVRAAPVDLAAFRRAGIVPATRRPAPAPCDGSSTADCMTRCTEGSARSCVTLARNSPERDQTYWWLYACMGGSAEGCRGIGKAYARGEFGDPDVFTAEKWYGIAAAALEP